MERHEKEAIRMKKTAAFIIVMITCICALAGCGGKESTGGDVTVDYGNSSIYSKEDMDAAISLIKEEFNTWDGCELHSIAYSSDDNCNADNIAWMNELEAANDNEEVFTQCIMFTTDFHSPKEGGGAWEPDTEYEDYEWWLGRSDGGSWKLMTWGY